MGGRWSGETKALATGLLFSGASNVLSMVGTDYFTSLMDYVSFILIIPDGYADFKGLGQINIACGDESGAGNSRFLRQLIAWLLLAGYYGC